MKVYMACPYSAPTHEEREQRFNQANKAAAAIMMQGHVVFSPISHSHPIAIPLGNELSHGFWLKQDLAFFDWADELWVVKFNGWDRSKGIEIEIYEWTKRNRKPIKYIEPYTLW